METLYGERKETGMNAAMAAPEQPHKHIRLNDAICGIDRMLGRLESLNAKIRDDEIASPVSEPPSRNPSLVDLLQDGGQIISDKINEAHRQIDLIDELLF